MEHVDLESMVISGKQSTPPDRGVYISGLTLVGAAWDYGHTMLKDNKGDGPVAIPCVRTLLFLYYRFGFLH